MGKKYSANEIIKTIYYEKENSMEKNNYKYAKCCINCSYIWDKINCDDANEKYCEKFDKTVNSFMVCNFFNGYLNDKKEEDIEIIDTLEKFDKFQRMLSLDGRYYDFQYKRFVRMEISQYKFIKKENIEEIEKLYYVNLKLIKED